MISLDPVHRLHAHILGLRLLQPVGLHFAAAVGITAFAAVLIFWEFNVAEVVRRVDRVAWAAKLRQFRAANAAEVILLTLKVLPPGSSERIIVEHVEDPSARLHLWAGEIDAKRGPLP